MDSWTPALSAGRALLGLSQEGLATLAGVSRQVVARIEKCEGNVLVEFIEKVRSALEVSGVVFIDGEGMRAPGFALARSARVQANVAQSFRPATTAPPHWIRHGSLHRGPRKSDGHSKT